MRSEYDRWALWAQKASLNLHRRQSRARAKGLEGTFTMARLETLLLTDDLETVVDITARRHERHQLIGEEI